MSQRHDDRELLTRYLLGQVSSTERDLVEDRYFSTRETLEELLTAEDEFIDDYVRGALNTSERVLFEENFLCSAERRQRLEFAKSLVEALAATAFGDSFASHQGTSDRLSLVNDPQEARAFFLALQGQEQPASAYRQELFSSLLAWLDPVRERAAEKYEIIRGRLIRMFVSQGSVDAEELADQTIDRVSRSLAELKEKYSGDPTTYFYGVANHVLRESHQGHTLEPMLAETIIENIQTASRDEERAHSCLQKCLEQLSERNRELIRQYYGLEKNAKTRDREELAQSLGIPLNLLRVRAHRIRTSLKKCIASCLEANDLP